MPIEERFITFNLDEIYQALEILCEKQEGLTLPKGSLSAIEIDEENADTQDDIFLKVAKEDGGDEEQIKFERAFFASALVYLCQANGIPLPRKGTKLLKILENKIIMKINLES